MTHRSTQHATFEQTLEGTGDECRRTRCRYGLIHHVETRQPALHHASCCGGSEPPRVHQPNPVMTDHRREPASGEEETNRDQGAAGSETNESGKEPSSLQRFGSR